MKRNLLLLTVSTLALAHRIVVMSDRRTVGELDAASASEIAILELAAPSSGRGRAA